MMGPHEVQTLLQKKGLTISFFAGLVFLFSPQNPAQAPTLLQGRIIDAQTQDPIPIVNIIISNTPYGAATDSDGTFKIHNLPPDLYVVEFRHVAYRKRFYVLSLKESEQVTLTVELQEEPVAVNEVDIVAEQEHPNKFRLTHAHTIITADQIRTSGVRKLSEVLRTFEPGTTQNTSMRRRRGLFATNQWSPFLIFLDGQYVQDIPGAIDNIVDVRQIDRIEISRWVGAAPNFGPGTSDRVIQIFTKKPR